MMGQGDVFQFLKARRNEWWEAKDIAQELGLAVSSVTRSLSNLMKPPAHLRRRTVTRKKYPWGYQYKYREYDYYCKKCDELFFSDFVTEKKCTICEGELMRV